MVATKAAPPRVMAFDKLNFQPRFAYPEMAEAVEIAGEADLSALSGGFARFKDARIPWTVQYDELILVLEGELTVETPAGAMVAGKHDTIWLPKGTELTYISRDALVFYSLHPANWASAGAQ